MTQSPCPYTDDKLSVAWYMGYTAALRDANEEDRNHQRQMEMAISPLQLALAQENRALSEDSIRHNHSVPWDDMRSDGGVIVNPKDVTLNLMAGSQMASPSGKIIQCLCEEGEPKNRFCPMHGDQISEDFEQELEHFRGTLDRNEPRSLSRRMTDRLLGR